MFNKILHANDGSEQAFHALSLALAVAKENQSDLHVVCVGEIPLAPEFIEDVCEATEATANRFDDVLQRARTMAAQSHVHLRCHVFAGHPVRDVIALAADFGADLLVIGAKDHSALYERLIGSRATRLMQLAPCPVLVAK